MNYELKLKISPVLALGISLLIVARFLDTVNIVLPLYFTRILAWIAYFTLLFYSFIIRSVVNIKKILLFLILIIISVLALASSSNRELIYIFILMWSIREEKFEKIVSIYTVTLSILMLLIALLTFAGVIENDYAMRNGVKRFFEGYTSWSILPFHYFSLVISCIFLRKQKISCVEWIALVSIATLVYFRTGTHTAFIITLIVLFATVLIKRWNILELNKWKKIKFLPWALMVTSILISVIFEKGYLKAVDYILSYRFSLQNEAIREYGIHLLGNNVIWYTWGDPSHAYLVVDNSYINVMLAYGIVTTFFVLYVYQVAIQAALATNDKYLLMGLIFILFTSLIWNRMIVIEDSFLMLSAARVFSRKKFRFHKKMIKNIYPRGSANEKNIGCM